MPNKKSENKTNPAGLPADENETEKVGLKPQREEENNSKKEARWKKVSALFDEAQKAYMEGSGFSEVITTLVETLNNLAQSEMPQSLGGLGVNDGPEMDLPAKDRESGESEEEPVPDEEE